MNILFRGGSPLSFSEGIRTYPRIIAEDTCCQHHNIHTVTHRGDTTFELIWDFDEEIALLRPNILILQFGVDDMFRPVYRSEFKENMVQAIRRARLQFAPTIILCTTHLFKTRYENDAAEIYNRTTREVATDLDCLYIPLHLVWMNHIHEKGVDVQDLLETDSRFPSQSGHNLTADAVMKKIIGAAIINW